MEGKKFLRADYRVPCDTRKHTIYRMYAGLMMLVSACRRCFPRLYGFRPDRSMPFSLAWSLLACLHAAKRNVACSARTNNRSRRLGWFGDPPVSHVMVVQGGYVFPLFSFSDDVRDGVSGDVGHFRLTGLHVSRPEAYFVVGVLCALPCPSWLMMFDEISDVRVRSRSPSSTCHGDPVFLEHGLNR